MQILFLSYASNFEDFQNLHTQYISLLKMNKQNGQWQNNWQTELEISYWKTLFQIVCPNVSCENKSLQEIENILHNLQYSDQQKYLLYQQLSKYGNNNNQQSNMFYSQNYNNQQQNQNMFYSQSSNNQQQNNLQLNQELKQKLTLTHNQQLNDINNNQIASQQKSPQSNQNEISQNQIEMFKKFSQFQQVYSNNNQQQLNENQCMEMFQQFMKFQQTFDSLQQPQSSQNNFQFNQQSIQSKNVFPSQNYNNQQQNNSNNLQSQFNPIIKQEENNLFPNLQQQAQQYNNINPFIKQEESIVYNSNNQNLYFQNVNQQSQYSNQIQQQSNINQNNSNQNNQFQLAQIIPQQQIQNNNQQLPQLQQIQNNNQQLPQLQQIQNNNQPFNNFNISKVIFRKNNQESLLQFEKNVIDGNQNKYIVFYNNGQKTIFAWNKDSRKMFIGVEKSTNYSTEKYYEILNKNCEIFLKLEGNQLVFTDINPFQNNKYEARFISDITNDNIIVENYKSQNQQQIKLQLTDNIDFNKSPSFIYNGIESKILSIKVLNLGSTNIYYEIYTQDLGRVIIAYNKTTKKIYEAKIGQQNLTMGTSGLKPCDKQLFMCLQNGQIKISDYLIDNQVLLNLNTNTKNLILVTNGQSIELPCNLKNENTIINKCNKFYLIKLEQNQNKPVFEQITQYFYESEKDTDEYQYFNFNKQFNIAWNKRLKKFQQFVYNGRFNKFILVNDVNVLVAEDKVSFVVQNQNINLNQQQLQQYNLNINNQNNVLDLVSLLEDYNNNKKFTLIVTDKQNGQQILTELNMNYKKD